MDNKIVIVVEGGVIQNAFSTKDIEITIIDLDEDSYEPVINTTEQHAADPEEYYRIIKEADKRSSHE